MRNCVNKNGKIYPSNGIFDKDTLYSTQGDQVYQSGLRVDLSVQMRGSLNCKSYLLNTEEELEMKLKKIPRFQIGASTVEEDNIPQMKTENVLSFVCGVNTKAEAVKTTKAFDSIMNKLRSMIDENEDALVKHPQSGKTLSLGQIRELKNKVSSHNQKVRQGLEGRLKEMGLTKGTAEYSMNYGEGMARNRLQVARYSMRISLVIRHNIYEEFSIGNFEERPETCDYHISKNRRYSEPRRYTVDVPIVSIKQYQQCREILSKFVESFEDLEKDFKQNESEVIYLVTSEDRTDEQVKNDAIIADKFETNLELATDEDTEEDVIGHAILASLLDSTDNEEGKKVSNRRSRKYRSDSEVKPDSEQQ